MSDPTPSNPWWSVPGPFSGNSAGSAIGNDAVSALGIPSPSSFAQAMSGDAPWLGTNPVGFIPPGGNPDMGSFAPASGGDTGAYVPPGMSGPTPGNPGAQQPGGPQATPQQSSPSGAPKSLSEALSAFQLVSSLMNQGGVNPQGRGGQGGIQGGGISPMDALAMGAQIAGMVAK